MRWGRCLVCLFAASAAATNLSCVAGRLVRTLAFPGSHATMVLPREAVRTTTIEDNEYPPGSAGDVHFVLIMLEEGLCLGWCTDCVAGFLVFLDCPEMQLLNC